MSFNKNKYVRTRKEVEVKFVDDGDVNKVKDIEEVRSDKSKNDVRKKLLKDADKCRTPETKTGRRSSRKSIVNTSNANEDNDDDDTECSYQNEETIISKPVALFQEGDVPGKAVFGFQTPKRKNAMVDKAAESADKITPNKRLSTKSPRTPASGSKTHSFTPRVRRSIPLKLNTDSMPEPASLKKKKKDDEVKNSTTDSNKKRTANDKVSPQKIVPKTPYTLRARLKTKIAAQIASEFQDFSDSEEDFIPSDEDDDEDEDEKSTSGSDSDDVFKNSRKISAKNIKEREPLKVLHNTPSGKRKRKDLTYAITSDEYFSHNSGKKSKTSNHTLNRLKNPRLAQDQLDKLLHDTDRMCSHQSALETLRKESCMQELFKKWCFCLREGYSILLYGLGSKRAVLNTFHEKILSKSHVLVINGFFPGLTIKEIIDSLAGELLNIKDFPSQLHEVIELIEGKLSARGSPRLFIIVHNLDGVMLRSDKAQALLARLAFLPKCNLLASIDHINAPLLWDDKKLSEYNFLWEDITTYSMYTEETSFENSLLVQRSSSLALASLKNVFQSLTKNGKDIFKILLEDCLANKNNQKYFGIGFSDLYWRCRDNFLVSTDLALRSQLTEFLDHQLVKWRKDSDHLIIPIDTSVLEQFQNLLQDS